MRLEHAILNNATWCAAVTGAHGIQSEVSEHYWSTDGAVPPYYSNLITLTKEEGTRAQLERIRALAAAPPKPDWGIKDSFARLDHAELEELGLRVLFEAHWFGLEVGKDEASETETDVRFEPVESPAELERWERAWQLSSSAPGLRVFPPELLSDPDIVFLAAMRGTALAGGVATNVSENAVGVSNLYTLHAYGAPSPPGPRHRRLRPGGRAPGPRVPRVPRPRALAGVGDAWELRQLGSGVGPQELSPPR
jgi:hypothetical protein